MLNYCSCYDHQLPCWHALLG
ncbi:SWIM zinc finger family protein [Olivibacter domesticus]